MRLHLLIVMVKAALKGYPLGENRKKAVRDNAAAVYNMVSHVDVTFQGSSSKIHMFRERVKLLSVMATAIASEQCPLGVHRREAVLNNIDRISEDAFPHKTLHLFPEILKVA